MENKDRIFYQKSLLEEKEEQLQKNSYLIQSFIEYCSNYKIELKIDNFDYHRTIGIFLNYPNIIELLNTEINADDDNLFQTNIIEQIFKKPFLGSGYYFSDKYALMAHPYFRRGYQDLNNFSPMFIDMFWRFNKPSIEKYIAIDTDRVRINTDGLGYLELDSWYGAKFKKTISDIEDGVVKLRPPLDLDAHYIEFLFGNTYSMDIKWTSKNGIKTFQLEEFKESTTQITKDGIEYFPVRYIHAEFDTNTKLFRHFDGAIHFYSEEEYYARRDSDLNFNNKHDKQQKALSQKLFKINGQLSVDDWVEFTCQYLTRNPLTFEYFEGELPQNIRDIIEKIRESKEK